MDVVLSSEKVEEFGVWQGCPSCFSVNSAVGAERRPAYLALVLALSESAEFITDSEELRGLPPAVFRALWAGFRGGGLLAIEIQPSSLIDDECTEEGSDFTYFVEFTVTSVAVDRAEAVKASGGSRQADQSFRHRFSRLSTVSGDYGGASGT